MNKLLVLIWVSFVILILLTILWKTYVKGTQYGFQKYGPIDIPYVILNIQGHSLNMIVDSGCGTSILNKPAIDKFNLTYEKLNKGYSLSALTEESVNAGCILVEYKLNEENVVDEFSVYDTPDFGNFIQMYGIEIHGLLGTSFFDAHKCTIDFKEHCLIIP